MRQLRNRGQRHCPAQAPLHFRGEMLNPAIDRRVVDCRGGATVNFSGSVATPQGNVVQGVGFRALP